MASARFHLSFLGAHARKVNPAISLSRTFQQFRTKYEATHTTPDSPELAERNRFLDLHAEHEDAAQLFSKLLDTAGLEKVREHNNQLASVFRYSDLNDRKKLLVNFSWKYFTGGKKPFLDSLKQELELTDEADGDQINTLIRRAHFVRFPERDASTLTEDQMLAALDGSTASAGKNLNPADEIKWAPDIVRQGFDAEYQRHDLIVAPTLKKLTRFAGQWKRDKYKAPYTSIIGPTMSGKTRLIKELAKHVCVAYICLRPPRSTGQPPRSELATHFFPNLKAGQDLEKHYSYLLAAILNTVSEFFSRPDIRAGSLEDRLAAWFDYSFQMDKTPKAQYNANVEKEMKSIQAEGLEPRQFLATAAKRMSQSIEFEGDGRLKMLLAIDEAGNLVNHIDEKLQIPYFRVFRRVLSHIPAKTGFFGVVTDTTSRVANFNPGLTQDPSSRYLNTGVDLFAPIYQISSLDVFVPKAPSSWDELLSAERLFSYGSPFYGLYFKGAMKDLPVTAVESTSGIAEAKLMCNSRSVSTEAIELSSPQCFAILGSVIQTRVSSYSPINSELVASYAAHCMFIDSDREMVVSDYPPQFVYALAANRILASDEAHWIKCINVLATAVNKGLADVGDAGETATRLILIRAMQTTKSIPCNGTDSIPDGYSVRLADFLETLIGKDKYTEFACIADGNKARLLKEGRIFFNHFTRISYTPSASDFLEFLYRGVAVQCKPGQAGFDELFTIYLAPASESPKLELENITFCGVQTKNQAGLIRSSSDWSKSRAKIGGVNNPYLALLFSLRTSSHKAPEWKKPEDSDDTGRVSHQFIGLNDIACLTPKMRSELKRLIDAVPDDLLKLHDKPNEDLEDTKRWIKQLSPVFYPRGPEQPTPQALILSPKPPKPSKTNSGAKKRSSSTQQKVSKRTCKPYAPLKA